MKDPSVTHIVVEHTDRFTRFGFRYLETHLELQDRTIEVVNLADNDREDVLADLVSIVELCSPALWAATGQTENGSHCQAVAG